MARGKRPTGSRSGVSRYTQGEHVIAAGKSQVEIELRDTLEHEHATSGNLSQDWIEEYIRNITLNFADRQPAETLELVNEVLDVVFDQDAVDPEALAEEPDEAYRLQVLVAYADHLEEHLRYRIEDDREFFFPTAWVVPGRDRLSPLADPT